MLFNRTLTYPSYHEIFYSLHITKQQVCENENVSNITIMSIHMIFFLEYISCEKRLVFDVFNHETLITIQFHVTRILV